MKPEGAERRLFPRKNLRSRVVFEDETGEGFIYFYSTDLSVGGIFFESDVPLKLGTQVFLSFSLRDGERPLRVTGQVVRIEHEKGTGFVVLGVGIKFLDLPEDTRRIIESFVNS